MMPTLKQAELLSKVSFNPIFRNNGWLNKTVSNDSAGLKTINGRSIVFIGAQSQDVGEGGAKDSVNLRSIPADCVRRDEVDLMDEDMVEMSSQRLNASRFRKEENFGSPTVPGYGIDLMYSEGSQNLWQIECKSCGKFTSLVMGFPKTVTKVGERWQRTCLHCGAEIFVEDGHWEPENRGARTASYWVDGLINKYADLEGYMYRYYHSEGSKLAEFQRSILGLAVSEGTNQLTQQDVYNCCRNDGFCDYSRSSTVIGIDVGDSLHYVIGIRTDRESYHIMTFGETKEFKELFDICRRMGVRFGVIDKGPDIHGVKEFQRGCGFPLFRCQYSDFMNDSFSIEGTVIKCNRNEMCDRVHSAFVNKMVTLPRRSPQVEEFADMMTKMMKDTRRHPDTGIPKTRWIKVGNKEDHYFHATLYFMLAAMRSSPRRVEDGEVKRFTKCKSSFYI
jgi:hypothetical protein